MVQLNTLLLVLLFLTSCGIQNRLLSTAQKVGEAKNLIARQSTRLDTIRNVANEKLDKSEMDTAIKGKYDDIINRLKGHLDEFEETVSAVDLFTKDKSNFSPSKYYSQTGPYVKKIDSFITNQHKHERIYQLVSEAVKVNAVKRSELAAFFDLGKYKIPPVAIGKFEAYFSSTIDSIAALANRYTDVPSTVHLVFVGYADATAIGEGSPLYSELSFFLKEASPSRQDLNRMLSQLRAVELERNMKITLNKNSNKFSNYNKLAIGSLSYGRGEQFPFAKITDYKDDDERRRIVLFYWAILPNI